MARAGIFVFFVFLLLSFSTYAQMLNKMVYDTAAEQEVLIDYCNRSGLESGEFGMYYKLEYDDYAVNDSLVTLIGRKVNDYHITIVFGSWCSDSEQQVPRFYKILDKAGYNDTRLTLIAVNRGKQTEKADIGQMRIERVPTLIVYKNKTEVGRIVETPENTLEEDLWRIVR